MANASAPGSGRLGDDRGHLTQAVSGGQNETGWPSAPMLYSKSCAGRIRRFEREASVVIEEEERERVGARIPRPCSR